MQQLKQEVYKKGLENIAKSVLWILWIVYCPDTEKRRYKYIPERNVKYDDTEITYGFIIQCDH